MFIVIGSIIGHLILIVPIISIQVRIGVEEAERAVFRDQMRDQLQPLRSLCKDAIFSSSCFLMVFLL